jgi:hypothetical protein
MPHSAPTEPTTAQETLPAVREQPMSAPVGFAPMVPIPEVAQVSPDRVYAGLSTQAFTPEQGARLMAAVEGSRLDVLPSGEVYLPQIHYRDVLLEVFGPGGWGMMPIGPPTIQASEKRMYQEWGLFIGGRCVATAIGEQGYYPNGRMSWGDARESTKSNALMRCCKDLGVAAECWEKPFVRRFQDEHCVRVECQVNKNGQDKIEVQWRRKGAPRLKGERGEAKVTGRSSGIARPERTDQPRAETPPPPEMPLEAVEGELVVEPGDAEDRRLNAQLRASIEEEERKKKAGAAEQKAVPKLIDDKQRRKIWATCRDCGVSPEQLHRALEKKGIVSVNDIPADGVPVVLDWIEKHRAAR